METNVAILRHQSHTESMHDAARYAVESTSKAAYYQTFALAPLHKFIEIKEEFV
jgi:hypothetical protein